MGPCNSEVGSQRAKESSWIPAVLLWCCQQLQSFHHSLSSQDEAHWAANCRTKLGKSHFTKGSDIRNSTLKSQVGSEFWGERCEGTGVCVSIISWGKCVPAQVMGIRIISCFSSSSQQLEVALNIFLLLLHSWSLIILLLPVTVKWISIHSDKRIPSLGSRCWMVGAHVIPFDI